VTGRTSQRFLEVLSPGEPIGLDASYFLPLDLEPNQTGSFDTLFHEIEVVPMLETLDKEAIELMNLEPGTRFMSREELLDASLALLEKVIETNWSSTKVHFVAHSSGWDSRLISALIRRIYERRGSSWLGEVIFSCCGTESPGFRAIMEYEGWEPSRYAAFEDLEDFCDFELDLSQVWRWANGPMLFARSPKTYMIRRLQEAGRLPPEDQIQAWSGYGTNSGVHAYANAREGNRIEERYGVVYRHHESLDFYPASEEILPFSHYDVLRLGVESSCRLGSDRRTQMLERFDPELFALPKLVSHWPNLQAKRMEKMQADYLASWYGRNVQPRAIEVISSATSGYCTWWSYWTAAGLVEHLLNGGYDIQVG